eukprot:jgi/Mesen1/2337/ME000155S01423
MELSPKTEDDAEYWKWSWDELAEFDLPALLEYVTTATGQDRILYIAHSQGTAIGMSALSQPQVAARVAAAVLLCPVAFMGHLSSRFLRVMAETRVDQMVAATGFHEFNLNNKLGALVVGDVCADGRVDCRHLLASITGPNCCMDMARVKQFLHWVPSSTSVQNLAHFCQMIRTGKWQKYDYRPLGNLFRYGSLHPPQYSPADIPADLPLLLAYGGLDALSSPVDVEYLATQLTSAPQMLYMPQYAHADFLLSVSVKADVYDNVTVFLRAHSAAGIARPVGGRGGRRSGARLRSRGKLWAHV